MSDSDDTQRFEVDHTDTQETPAVPLRIAPETDGARAARGARARTAARRIPVGLATAAVIVAVLALLQSRPDAARRVPNLSHRTVAAATAAARSAGFSVASATVPGPGAAGTVLRQSPAAGAVASRGKPIRLFVSQGAAQVQVPNVRGNTLDAAIAGLAAAGLRAGDDVEFVAGRDGIVVKSEPSAGRSADRNSRVRLYVGSGRR